MKVGLIGLGHMGFNLMLNLLDHGHEVVAWNRSKDKRERARKESAAIVVDSVEDMVNELNAEETTVIISIIDAGKPIDYLLFGKDEEGSGLAGLLCKDSVFVDMANSHYQDTERRSSKLAEHGIKMLGVGISGGITGARGAACLMAGGDSSAFETVEPIFADISVKDGYGYFGTGGAGHFVKMVHNGIEYGMMQSIAEGVSLIEAKKNYEVDFPKLLDVWNHGSIIESRLVGFLKQAYGDDPGLEKQSAEIGDKGTGKWTIQEALDLGVPLTTISHALFARYNSRLQNTIGWKAVMAMRKVFGGHTSDDRSDGRK